MLSSARKWTEWKTKFKISVSKKLRARGTDLDLAPNILGAQVSATDYKGKYYIAID